MIGMPDPIIIIDISEIRESRLDELRTAMTGLVEFVESNEPRPVAYCVALSNDATRVTVLQIHPDPSSAEEHMTVAAEEFPRFRELIELVQMDIYGKPSDELLAMMRNKAQMLGNAPVGLHELHAGFVRFAAAQRQISNPSL
jgi:hypothetical protein